MEERIAWFQRSVKSHFGGRESWPGCRYPADLRQEGGELARELLLRGETYSGIGKRLGVSRRTVQRWVAALATLGEEPEEAEPDEPRAQGLMLREVEVVGTRPESGRCPGAPSHPGRRVLVTAAGHRVEGLEVPELIRVLEVLG